MCCFTLKLFSSCVHSFPCLSLPLCLSTAFSGVPLYFVILFSLVVSEGISVSNNFHVGTDFDLGDWYLGFISYWLSAVSSYFSSIHKDNAIQMLYACIDALWSEKHWEEESLKNTLPCFSLVATVDRVRWQLHLHIYLTFVWSGAHRTFSWTPCLNCQVDCVT